MPAATSDLIDRQATTPYYQQLSNELEARMRRGTITPGERLPSEHELCGEFGLSRATVRQGLQLLESRGLVSRIPGRGVYAAEREPEQAWAIQDPQGFLENAIGSRRGPVTTEVLRHGPALLPAHVCRALAVPEHTAGFELVRRRLLEGVPVLYSLNYSPPGLVPVVAGAHSVLDGTGSLSEVLATAGYSLGGAHRSVRATSPGPEIAAALDVDTTAPILHIRSTSWTASGVRYDLYDTFVRSDVMPLEVNVTTGR